MAFIAASTLQYRPKAAEILASRKFRLFVAGFVAALIFLALVRHYEAYPTNATGPDQQQGELEPESESQQSSYKDDIDWSRFAYIQYATNSEYLCNSVMLFESLHQLGSKPDRVLMYPSRMVDSDATESRKSDGKLVLKARDEYNVHLVPISVQHRDGADRGSTPFPNTGQANQNAPAATWADSFTKLLAFNQTQYDRVLSLDSDGVILQPMDELFLLPPSPVAMPRAYWLLPDKPILSSQVMLVEPSEVEFKRVMGKVESAGKQDYDMEIVNDLYKDSALILPHRPYDVLTSEWRSNRHANYLGSDVEEWDPVAIYNEAKFVHFSDWPVAKPWLDTEDRVIKQKQPVCPEGEETCMEREIWNGFYSDFKERKKRVCDNL